MSRRHRIEAESPVRGPQTAEGQSRIDISAVNPHREVQRRVSVILSTGTDHGTGLDCGAPTNRRRAQERIGAAQAATMVNRDGSVTHHGAGEGNRARGRSPDGGAEGSSKVNAPMTRIPALGSEGTDDGCRERRLQPRTGARCQQGHGEDGKQASPSHPAAATVNVAAACDKLKVALPERLVGRPTTWASAPRQVRPTRAPRCGGR